MTPQMTTQQRLDLKANIQANTSTVLVGGVPTAINTLPRSEDNSFLIASWYNLVATPMFLVWKNNVSVDAILNGIIYANFTPNDAPNPATDVLCLAWNNRAILLQIKQINLQMMLQGRLTVDATLARIRTGLQDATENLPSGNNGNNRSGGWNNVLPLLSQPATNAEMIYVPIETGTGTPVQGSQINAGDRVLFGPLSAQEVNAALDS